MIAGREPGVVSLPSSGYTGEGARIRIRGSASLSQLNEPIIYVDGIRVDRSAIQSFNDQGSPSRLDDIPPESIERVEILKGAAAATLYGTEASNGVIQIFTKRGRAGAPRFSVQADLSALQAPTNRILPVADFMGRDCETDGCASADDQALMAKYSSNIQKRFGSAPSGAFAPFQQDVVPDMLTTGYGQTYSASVQGGSDAFQYFVSGRFAYEDGVFDAQKNFPVVDGMKAEVDTNRRISSTSNFTIIPSSKVRIGVQTLYSEMEHHTPDNSNNIYGVFSSMLMTQLRLVQDNNKYGNPAFATARENMYQQNYVNSSHFAGSTNIGFTPTDDFRLDATFGVDFTSDDAVAFRPYAWNVDGFSGSTPDGNRTVRENRSREITADLKGSYTAASPTWRTPSCSVARASSASGSRPAEAGRTSPGRGWRPSGRSPARARPRPGCGSHRWVATPGPARHERLGVLHAGRPVGRELGVRLQLLHGILSEGVDLPRAEPGARVDRRCALDAAGAKRHR